MRRLFLCLIVLTTCAFTALTGAAQPQRKSPHETISTNFDGTNSSRVMVIYGRPYTKDPRSGEPRTIWGTVVRYGMIWRAGADEATLFITQQPLELGGTLVPAGAYSLYMIPYENGSAKLIVNRQIGQWGLDYDEKLDLARIDMKREDLPMPVEQFTITIAKTATGGVLKMAWANTAFSVPFVVRK